MTFGSKNLYTRCLRRRAYLRVPRTTFETWARGYTRRRKSDRTTKARPIITAIPAGRRLPEVPFIGLAEGMVLAAFRGSRVPMQRIRPAIGALEDELGMEHALASERLYTDGAEILYDFAMKGGGEHLRGLTVVRTRQRVFVPVIQEYLSRITYDTDGWAQQLRLPVSRSVIVDPQSGIRATHLRERRRTGRRRSAPLRKLGIR